jgi:hypothetical protein
MTEASGRNAFKGARNIQFPFGTEIPNQVFAVRIDQVIPQNSERWIVRIDRNALQGRTSERQTSQLAQTRGNANRSKRRTPLKCQIADFRKFAIRLEFHV